MSPFYLSFQIFFLPFQSFILTVQFPLCMHFFRGHLEINLGPFSMPESAGLKKHMYVYTYKKKLALTSKGDQGLSGMSS